jgi:hypothetical protein
MRPIRGLGRSGGHQRQNQEHPVVSHRNASLIEAHQSCHCPPANPTW